MLNRKLIGTALSALLLAGASAQAAVELPPKAIGPDTVFMMHMDAANLTPDTLRQTAQTVLGPNNMQQANQQIAKFQQKYDRAIKAGAQSMTFVGDFNGRDDNDADKPGAAGKPKATASSNDQGAAYIQLKSGADEKALKQMITEDMDPAQRDRMVFERDGKFLVMHDKDTKLPASGDAARGQQFSEALASAGNAGMIWAFVPNQAIRDKFNKQEKQGQPKALQDAAPVVLNSRWMTLTFNVGQTPDLTITDAAADAASAQKLTQSVNSGLAEMKQFAQAMQNGGGAQGGANPMAMMFAPMIAPLADALKPSQNGNKVVVSLKGPALSMVAGQAMMFGQMFMNGPNGAAGGPPGAGAPGRRPPGSLPPGRTPSGAPTPPPSNDQ